MVMNASDKAVLGQLQEQHILTLLSSHLQEASPSMQSLLSRDDEGDVSNQFEFPIFSPGGSVSNNDDGSFLQNSQKNLPGPSRCLSKVSTDVGSLGTAATDATAFSKLVADSNGIAIGARLLQKHDVGIRRSLKEQTYARTRAKGCNAAVESVTGSRTACTIPSQGGYVVPPAAQVHSQMCCSSSKCTLPLRRNAAIRARSPELEGACSSVFCPYAGRARSPAARQMPRDALMLRDFAPQIMPELRVARGVSEQRWEASICQEKKIQDALSPRSTFRSHNSDCLSMTQLRVFYEKFPAQTRACQDEVDTVFSSSVCVEKQVEDAQGSRAFRIGKYSSADVIGAVFPGESEEQFAPGVAEQCWEASICQEKKARDASPTRIAFRSHDSDCLAIGQLRTLHETSPARTRSGQVEVDAHFCYSVCAEKQHKDWLAIHGRPTQLRA